jgi:ubiquinone/menaquinone biosynthesis C-methylase UbiE
MSVERTAKFWDKLAPRYSAQPVADESSYQKKLEITQTYFNADMAVLEIGCGTGSTAIAHAPYVKHILATDISSNMLEIAQAKADAQQLSNVSFQRSSVDDLRAPGASFDAVLALNILHLLENWDEALGKIYALLKPGGIFVSSTICMGDGLNLLRLILPVCGFLRLIPAVKTISRSQLEQSVVDAGFDIDYQWQPENSKAVFLVAKREG